MEDLWTASGSSATLGQTMVISLSLAVLAALITHLLTKRRENGRWAKQNTLHALQRATEAFYTARQHYTHLLPIEPWSLILRSPRNSSSRLTEPRDWTPLQEGLQRVHEALIDVQLSSGKYRRRVLNLSKLAETMVEKLDETAYVSSGVNDQGGEWSKSVQKNEAQYLEDSMSAINAYESAFGQFREDSTADLTARWLTRRRHKFQRWQQHRRQARQARTDRVSSDHSQDMSDARKR
ncbi:hypothetical protein [Kocuria rosea]|uniref:hypothetical protein n=1 Tax=Kocuria rosea TaxID=1275 RepID=UPI00203B87B1|nr:hypothetical protein [Kocuria rosea]